MPVGQKVPRTLVLSAKSLTLSILINAFFHFFTLIRGCRIKIGLMRHPLKTSYITIFIIITVYQKDIL